MGNAAPAVRIVGRYALYQPIAAGGMATVHLGRLLGAVGFSRTVAIKRLHAQFASDAEFVSMFLDEARIATRIRHPNVVPTLDVVATGGELFLVMEYVAGESIARLARALNESKQRLPLPILSAVMGGVLHGLHAAHVAKDEHGNPLGIVHRDVSPQNVLVGTDGVARLLDFGVAKAAGRMQTTRDGQIKGKLSYMPPEQLCGGVVTRQSDIYAAGVMLWELVAGQRLFGGGDNEGAIIAKVLEGRVEAPSKVLMRSANPKETLDPKTLRELEDLDSTILRALATEPAKRFATAREMAMEIERKLPPATGAQVADWVDHVAKDVLNSRAAMIAEIESSTSHSAVEPLGGHVQSVLSARSKGGSERPNAKVVGLESPELRTMTQRDALGRPLAPATSVGRAYAGSAEPPVTQPSSISVASGAHSRAPGPPSRGRTMLALIVGITLGAALLGGGIAWRSSRAVKATAQAVAPEPSLVPAAGGASAVHAETVPPPAVVATRPELVGAASAVPHGKEVVAVPKGSLTVPGVHLGGNVVKPPPPPPRAGAPVPPPPPPAAVADCTPPYWFDEHQVKRYKTQCLDK